MAYHGTREKNKQKLREKKTMKTNEVILYVLLIVFVFFIGVLAGTLIGTYALIDKVAYGLAGSTFIVNVNETKLMQEFNNTIIPELQKTILQQKQ